MGLRFLGTTLEKAPQIDRYDLIAEIASGGMASVYLARTRGMGGFQRFFAIKRMHPHLGSEEGFVQMFLDEARLVAQIRHQHVVPVLEVGASDNGYFLVMEYIEGATLGTFLSSAVHGGKKIPPSVVVRIMLDTLAGLHAAHELRDGEGAAVKLVHRDVSPQNILIDINGISRISDFGVAHANSRLGSTRVGQLKGKVAYMAPEQARGEAVDARADVFAAAVVLWESLCTKRLFLGENEAATLNRLMFEEIVKLRKGNPTMPASLEKVLDKALSRKPIDRYASAAEFAEALESCAKASRMLGSTADVAAFVSSVIGESVETQRVAVRSHLAEIDRRETENTKPGEVEPLAALPTAVAPPSGSTTAGAAMEVPATRSSQERTDSRSLPLEALDLRGDEHKNRRPAWLIAVAAVSMAATAIGAGVGVRAYTSQGASAPNSTASSSGSLQVSAAISSSVALSNSGAAPSVSAPINPDKLPKSNVNDDSRAALRAKAQPSATVAATATTPAAATSPPPAVSAPPHPTATVKRPSDDDDLNNPYRY